MKNAVIFILLLTTVVVGYVAATSRLRLSLENLEGKTERVVRGDLRLPINATGEIRPARRVEIKAEASGEVIEIARRAGDRVKAGDLLIRLQPDDELRSVNRARQEVQIAEARLATARITLQQARSADIASAQAQVDQLVPGVELARFRKEKFEEIPDQRREEEMLQRSTSFASQLAQLQAAQASLEKAMLAVPRAEQEVKQAEATAESALASLGDAEKRLKKTDIVAPVDGVLADIRVQIGEVIQGGRTTLTGGTLLAVVLDVDRLIVRAEVDESDIGRVLAIAPAWAKPGREEGVAAPADLRDAARAMEKPPVITVESFRDQEFEGVIERIYPEPKSLNNVITYQVDVVVTSENRSILLPGMRADVRFTAEHVENVVLCPNEAIREGPEGGLGVYIPKPGAPTTERATQFVPCKLGLDDGNQVEIREGLAEGAIVYTKLPVKPERGKDRKKGRDG
ncbi:MAG: HlyD family efflux transporter periplasmic adaptor subunit [Planctomycetes bacterium]|nr:HlyD family efflux transporter periplasmic adaptor subunit [Planctomycetota bacterium]